MIVKMIMTNITIAITGKPAWSWLVFNFDVHALELTFFIILLLQFWQTCIYMCRQYFVKLFWRKGPTSESVVELNETNDRTLADFEKYAFITANYISGHAY